MTNITIQKPIFIFGCSNSGTTILWDALRTHEELSGPDIEGQDIASLPPVMRHYLGKATFRLWAHPQFKLSYYVSENDRNENDFKKINKTYVQTLRPHTRFITKSPADTLRARLIQSYYPDAYFIAIVRNGYAVSEGIIRKRKHDPDRPQFKGLFTTIEEAAEQWLRANVIVMSHQNFLRNYMIVKYENLIKDPGTVLQSILNFCELKKTNLQVPIFEKNKNNEQIARLSKYEIEVVTRISAPMLIHFGYELLAKKLTW